MANVNNGDVFSISFDAGHFRCYVGPNGTLPTRSHNSAGYDLYSSQDVLLDPLCVTKVPTAIHSDFPPDVVALVWDRSSMAQKGIHTFAGVIDSDYRGEWQVMLYNSNVDPFTFSTGDRVAQVLLHQLSPIEMLQAGSLSELTDSDRGSGGFGSTGA